MKETYLHYIWKTKSILFQHQRLVNQELFELIDPGFYNTESGPDFFNGSVKIDGVIWRGNIELHINSSDWYAHNHHVDQAYNNVILHVVYNYDRPVFIEDRELPTLELKSLISKEHFLNFHSIVLMRDEISCGKLLDSVDSIYIEQMKERAIIRRLNHKIEFLSDEPYRFKSHLEIFYLLLLKSFGKKVNDECMLQLALAVPFKLLQLNDVSLFSAFILGGSGLTFSKIEFKEDEWNYLKHKYNLKPISTYQWKSKGLRPVSFPRRMLLKLVWWLENIPIEEMLNKIEGESVYEYLSQRIIHAPKELNLNQKLIDMVMINCIIPFIWWKSQILQNDELKERALDLYQKVSFEQNKVIAKWKKYNVTIKNAYDSQALLEIYNDFCSVNKCLECSVGIKVLKN